MTFTWKTPPWQRRVDSSFTATVLTDNGGARIGVVTEAVRGDDATEALADLIMGPGGGGDALLAPGFIGVVVRKGVDAAWMARPQITVTADGPDTWTVVVHQEHAGTATVYTAAEVRDLQSRLLAHHGN